MVTHEGSCHCGAVRFRVTLADDARDVIDCNCSVCTKKGNLHLIVPEDRFELVAGAEMLTTYAFGTGLAKHTFCARCGMHPFYRPRSHPESWDVNVRCLDGVPLAHWNVVPFDGQHWEESVHLLRDGG